MSCLDNMKPIVLESSYGIYCGDKHSTEPSTEKTTNYGVTANPESRYKNPRADKHLNNFLTSTVGPWLSSHDHLAWFSSLMLEGHNINT